MRMWCSLRDSTLKGVALLNCTCSELASTMVVQVGSSLFCLFRDKLRNERDCEGADFVEVISP